MNEPIEQIVLHIFGPLLSELPKTFADFKILLLPDHPPPIAVRSHTREPVPYVLYQHSQATQAGTFVYDEATATETGRRLEVGSALMRIFLEK